MQMNFQLLLLTTQKVSFQVKSSKRQPEKKLRLQALFQLELYLSLGIFLNLFDPALLYFENSALRLDSFLLFCIFDSMNVQY